MRAITMGLITISWTLAVAIPGEKPLSKGEENAATVAWLFLVVTTVILMCLGV